MPSYGLRPRLDVAVNYTVGQVFCSLVLHYTAPATIPTPGQLQNGADAISTRFAAVLKPALSKICRYEGTEVRYVNEQGGRYIVSEVNAGPGTSGLDPTVNDSMTLPTETAVVIKKIGDGPSKRANGTSYISGVAENDSSGNGLVLAARERFESLANAIMADNTVGGMEGQAVNLSRTSNLMYDIVHVQLNPILGHLSRRRPKR